MSRNIERYAISLIVLLVVGFTGCGGHNDDKSPNQQKETLKEEGKATTEAPVLTGAMLEGKKVYDQYCLTCHQSNGAGVPHLNPPLKSTDYVVGDKERLIGIVLNGSNEGLEVEGTTYNNAMPPHDFLSDDQVADVLSYVRNSFGNEADTVAVSEVKTVRGKLK